MDIEQAPRAHSRQRTERRRGIGDVLHEFVARLQAAPQADIRACFQEIAARSYGFDHVHLSDPPVGRADAAPARGPGSLRQFLPGGGALVASGRLAAEADAWDAQQLEALADVAVLVLEMDRLRGPRHRPGTTRHAPVLVGSSAAMARVRSRIAQVARTPFPVLVLGESGVGKEVVARLVHDQSRRCRGPFVAVNCAAIVETLVEAELFGIEDRTATGVRGRRGKFEQADGGTLFLDEIGDLAASAQAKLLRVLQDLTVERVGSQTATPVDVRVVAATNRDLLELVSEGKFRADLYYRLNGVEIEVPPLRARLEDVPALVAHVLSRHDALGRVTLADEALMAMYDYRWPGNVRELERVVERALALCDDRRVTLEHLPTAIAGAYGDVVAPALREPATLRAFTAKYVRLIVERLGNRREACRVLDISYHTLRAYLAHPEARWDRRDPSRGSEAAELAAAALVADRGTRRFATVPTGEGSVP